MDSSGKQFVSTSAEPSTGLYHRARWDISDNPPHLNLEAGTLINKPGKLPAINVVSQNGRDLNFHFYYNTFANFENTAKSAFLKQI